MIQSTVSHWQATDRGKESLYNHGRNETLPTDVIDYLIIGAGITGASLAYHLSRPGGAGEGKKVVVVDTKDLASGASGRNGGHIAPASFTYFSTATTPLEQGGAGLTEEQALEALENEIDTLDYAEKLVEEHGLEVDFWRGQKLEVKVSDESVDAVKEVWRRYTEARKRSARFKDAPLDWELITDPVQAKEISRIPSAKAIIRGPAGTNHPHKLTTALLKLALASTACQTTFHSWTPVNDLTQHEGVWVADCGERGTIRAKEVVLATNGYTNHIIPNSTGINKHVTPYRGHAGLVTPPPSYSGASGTLSHSYGIEDGPYLMTTPDSGVVLGPFNASALRAGIVTQSDIFGTEDDTVVLPSVRQWLGEYCRNTFEAWGDEAPGEGLQRAWSGIMGHSRDHLPLIGRVPDKRGLWAALAFHGHGMARILTCTRGLAVMMRDNEWDDRLPRCYELSRERLDRAQAARPPI